MDSDSIWQCFSESGQRTKLHYGSWTRAGADPYGKPKANQDSHSVTEYLGGEDVCLLGVYDGHGVDGAKVSQHLAKIVPQHLSEAEELRTQNFRDMFEEQMPICNKHLVDTAGIKTHLSGSTAIMALLHSSGLLTIANVGDSRCLIGRLKGEKIQAEALNTDHTPLVPEEAARITACKGRIQPYIFEGQFVGPKRIWLRFRDSPGLSMTRAFGDEVGATIGIVPDPEITQVFVRPEDKYLVLCSDGIYEFMDNDYIMSIIHHQASSGWSPTDVAKCLVAEANRQWMEEEDGIIDDCTVIVAFLDVSAPIGVSKKVGKKEAHLAIEGTVSRRLSQVAKKATSLLTPQEIMQKVSISRPSKK